MRMLREMREEQRVQATMMANLRQDLDGVEARSNRPPATAAPPAAHTAAPPPAAPAPSSAPAAQPPQKRPRMEKGQYVREQTQFLINLVCLEDPPKVDEWKDLCKEILQGEYTCTAVGTPQTKTVRELSKKAALKMWENEA